ncbi:hypothetical protein BN1007_80446 [Klebsiella variicola]|uniref:hypothetical protein n=1 Tax=Klebsiella variicola TaxID=244366 RepID=UPI000671DC9B|nr:hypothetical protein [Klebsiella variicola]MCB3775503.1 hypothetical protein [Klebsiella pneumoniae]CTQ20637.1 hypothetical protein BN1007_80446 [Klebsiella variicola]HBR0832032.1 hypothetical protein [Klebsiella pneumoniae]
MKFSKIDYSLFIVTLFIFLFFMSIQFPSMHKDVKITDWLSVIINISLALFAYKGFILANSWKDDLTRGDGYKIALEIKDNKLHNLRMLSHLFTNVELAYHCVLNALHNKSANIPVMNITNYDFAINNTKNIGHLIEGMKTCTRDLEISFRNLNSVGWEVSDVKKEKIQEVISMINDTFPIIFPIFYASQQLLGLANDYYDNQQNIIPTTYNQSSQENLLEMIKSNSEKFKSKTEDFSEKCSKLLDDDLYILNFFHPIKKEFN